MTTATFCPHCSRKITFSQSVTVFKTEMNIYNIIQSVSDYYHVMPSDLSGKRRTWHLSQVRHVAMYLCKKFTKETVAAIAKAFRRDHTTVLYAVKTITERLAVDMDIQSDLFHLEQMMKEA
jgi:chromosomal replication initiator protein